MRLGVDLIPEILADVRIREPFGQLMRLDAILLGLALERAPHRPGSAGGRGGAHHAARCESARRRRTRVRRALRRDRCLRAAHRPRPGRRLGAAAPPVRAPRPLRRRAVGTAGRAGPGPRRARPLRRRRSGDPRPAPDRGRGGGCRAVPPGTDVTAVLVTGAPTSWGPSSGWSSPTCATACARPLRVGAATATGETATSRVRWRPPPGCARSVTPPRPRSGSRAVGWWPAPMASARATQRRPMGGTPDAAARRCP